MIVEDALGTHDYGPVSLAKGGSVIPGREWTYSTREQPSFGKWLQGELERHGWTMTEGAGLLGVHLTTLRKWIHGWVQPGEARLDLLASVFHTNRAWLGTLIGP